MVLEVAVMSGFSECPNDFCTVHAFLAQKRIGFNEPCQYRWPCQKPNTSYGGTSSFVCAIEYQSSVRMFKGDCPKPDDENWSALATFVGQRLDLEVNSRESIVGHCHSSAVGLMAYFGFIQESGALSVHELFKMWMKLPTLFMCNTAEDEEDELALMSHVTIDGHVKAKDQLRRNIAFCLCPLNISQVSRFLNVTVQNRMMKTGCIGNFCWPEIRAGS
ncbi:hypothetical protein CEXT_603151 [Caerostris extrusa]|uniref:Uncharacterized protein n=1 Tax=Caerostris extrusa TaxID=172846 RepID=A0AAV4SSF2_CAEEX|nr:hypothetical protein CEXT_603151 [Caerostris extrusa]